ncbi:hypothetical protein [Clostridium ljungdahlii]|uniref:hypothetical protein n=1 Tax=Clostridium ljungdahlii TaxID=1538 RepID=UPI0038656037
METKLTIISAAAGSGKTTSVISWIYSRKLNHNTVWISLDERDDNLDIFGDQLLQLLKSLKIMIWIANKQILSKTKTYQVNRQ